MFTRSPVARAATITLATGVLLIARSGSAAADPPALDVDDCATTIAAAGRWPGRIGDGHHGYRLVSDAFDSYLSGRPACTADPAGR